jgi:transcription initiation factor TFIID TATA-box-binding protein
MEAIHTHPANAAQAKAFATPGSLSFPSGVHDLTPPSAAGDKLNGQPAANGVPVANGNGVTPATPAATPAATQVASGLTPTLQYV